MDEQQITLILLREDGTYDITELVEKIEWSGRKGAAPRTLKVSLLDSSEYERSNIDVEQGQSLIFSWNGVGLFWGMILRQDDSTSRMMKVTAYDLCRYLSNNKDSFSYENRTLSYIFRDICERFNIPMGDVAECSYKMEEMSGQTTTPWDVLTDAMYETFQNTGERYYIYADMDKCNLIKRADSMVNWVVEEGSNLMSFSRSRDFSKITTRVKLIGEKDRVLLLEVDEDLERRFGIFQAVEKPNKDISESKYKQIAQNRIKVEGRPDDYISITGTGITDCISGCSLCIIYSEKNINSVFYIDEDVHTFAQNRRSINGGFNHTMKLKVRATNEIQG